MRKRTTMKGEFLMLAQTPNDAKQIESQLRSAGHPLRVLVAPGLDSFTDILEKSDIVMVIHDAEFADCKLIQVAEAVQRSRPGTPILELASSTDTRRVADAIGKGAQGIITMSNWDHLELVCQREYDSHQLSMELAELQNKLAELEEVRSQDLGAASAPGLRVQEGIVVHANQVLSEALGYGDPDDLAGMPLMDLVDPQHQDLVKSSVKACLKGHPPPEAIRFTLLGDDEASCAVHAHLHRIEFDGEPAVEVRGVEHSKPGRESNGGQPGRQALCAQVADFANADAPGVAALVFIAIDEFETIEQRAGYAGAEQVVEAVMDMLCREVTGDDRDFRFSLFEWALLCRRDSVEDITKFVSHFQRTVARHIFTAADKEVSCTISGVVFPLSEEEEEDPETLLKRIRGESRALAEQGGNGLKVSGSTAEELERKKQSARWLEEIRKALKSDRFDLAYQNIASLAGEDRQYSDILLRMTDEKGNEVVAAKFLPFAEEHGMMPDIDRWVISKAVSVLEKQLAERRDPCFFVRLAEDTLAEGDEFVKWLKAFIDAHPKVQERLVLVIRERHLQNHMKRAQALVKACQAMKLFIALDHFGNTRHSHQLLPRLKVDFVKLHADFTESIGKTGTDQQALEAIMEAARQNKVKTIAERVTDANGMARLWQMGVNYIMGSHVHEPDRELSKTRFRMS